MSAKRKTLGVAAALVGLFSALCAVVGVTDAASLGDAIGGGIFFSGISALSGWGAVSALREPKLLPGAIEKIVLQLAAEGEGRVTAADLCRNSSLTLEQSTAELRLLAADSIVTEGGTVIYKIRGVLSLEEKRNAVDLLDGN